MKRNKKEDILLNTDNDDISMLAEIQTDPDEVTAMEFNKEIPVMPLRNMVMFPSVVMPVTIGRPSTLKLINAAYKKKLPIAVVCQIQGDMDDPGFNDVYHVGVIGKILRVFEMPWKYHSNYAVKRAQSTFGQYHQNVSIFKRDGDSYSGGK